MVISRPRSSINWLKVSLQVLRLLVLAVLALLMSAPFIWMLSTSFKRAPDIFTAIPTLLPTDRKTGQIYLSFDNYSYVIDQGHLGQAFLNSLFVVGIVIPLKLFLDAIAAYAFARIPFPGRDKIFLILLSSLMMPGIALLIPRFFVTRTLGLYDSLWGLIIPLSIAVIDVFLMRQFFMTLPLELEEAAMIDGAGRFRIFAQIIIPLSQPVLAVVTITSFIYHWNDFTWPLVILNDPSKYTLPLALAQLNSSQISKPGLVMAGATFSVLPVILVILIFQKRILQGIAITGIKG